MTLNFAGMANLLRGDVESTLLRLGARQVDFRLNVIGFELADDSLGTPNTDLGLGNGFGADSEIGRNVLEDDGSTHRDFGGLFIAGNDEPEAGRQKQRQQLQSEVVEDIVPEEP